MPSCSQVGQLLPVRQVTNEWASSWRRTRTKAASAFSSPCAGTWMVPSALQPAAHAGARGS